MATAADDARFEVLEEETHYPASHPKSAAAAAAAAAASEDEQKREQQAEETLEAQLARLVLDAQEGDHADAAAATRAKELGNKFFGGGRFLDAIESYTTALKLCPSEDESLAHDRAVYFSNRAACLLKLGRTDESIDDCTQAIALSPAYVKALLRRAEAFEKLDKLEEALADYDAVLKLDAGVKTAAAGHSRLVGVVEERREKMKAEMLDKLKGFGNTLLGKFGLSTDNFQMVQDPATGSYSVNFSQNPGQSKQ